MIRKKNLMSILLLFVEIFIILIFSLIKTPSTFDSTMKLIGNFAIILFIISVFAVYRITKVVNAYVFFVVFAYLFSFGQCIMAVWDKQIQKKALSLNSGFFSCQDIKEAAFFAFMGICFTCIGYCLKNRDKTTVHLKIVKQKSTHLNKIRRIGWTLLFIGILPQFIMLFEDIKTLSLEGYGATLVNATGIYKFLSIISGLFTSGILILYCFEEKKRKTLFFIIGIYWLLQILGGSRIEIFRMAVTFIVISGMYRKELTKKRLGLIIFLSLIGVFVLSIVSNVRNLVYSTGNVVELFSSAMNSISNDNFIVAAINEMGNTQIVNTLVYTRCPSEIDFQYGLSFVKIIWGIFPNFIGSAYTGYIGVDITFSKLYTIVSTGLGASYLAEGYWNFGYFSMIYFLFFGSFFGWVSVKFKEASHIDKYDPANLFLLVYIIYYMIFLVRSESLGFGRNFVYYAIFPYVLMKSTYKAN